MRMPIALAVALTIARELIRALMVPLHTLGYLLNKRKWQARAAKALAESTSPRAGDALSDFLRRHPPEPGRPGHLFLSCGEASGETHAVHLVRAVEQACEASGDHRPPRWSGFGGSRLEAEGVELLFPLSEHAVMGLGAVLKSIPLMLKAYARFLRALQDDPPDLLVLIDYPGLHLVMAEAARRCGVPVLHYVAPQYWAWGPWRMQRYRKAVDGTLTILPFEPAFFADAGLASEYIGHPLLDEVQGRPPEPGAVEAAKAEPTLVLMPGSRRKEIELQLEPMLRIAANLKLRHPELRVVIPHRDQRRVAIIEQRLDALGQRDLIAEVGGDPGAWLAGGRAALVKSGTGSLEACLHQLPTVVVYAVQPGFQRWALHNMLTVPYFASANLCMDRRIVPEIAVEDDAQWNEVERDLEALLRDGETRERCLADLRELRVRLGEPGASDRAARWILPYCPDA